MAIHDLPVLKAQLDRVLGLHEDLSTEIDDLYRAYHSLMNSTLPEEKELVIQQYQGRLANLLFRQQALSRQYSILYTTYQVLLELHLPH